MARRIARFTSAAAAVALAVGALAGCASGAAPETADDAREKLIESGVLKVGTEGTYAPFTFHAPGTGELTGYDIDVIEAIAAEIGVEVEFSETEWDSIFAGLTSGRYDLVANQVSWNEERAGTYALSEPYTISRGVIVAGPDRAESISGLEDIAGLSSAQSTTSNWAKVATDADATIAPVEGFTQAITLVSQGRADITLNDSLVVAEYFTSTNSTDVVVAAELPEEYTTESVFALRKDSPLLEVINDALQTIKDDGTLARISEEWFGKDVSQ